MKYGKIPHLEVEFPRIVCGTDFMMGAPPSQTFSALDMYWRLGGRCFDSAHIYGPNTNVFAAWVSSRGVKDEVLYFDKGCHPYGRSRVTREDMQSDILQNHQNLGVSQTTLFVLHRDDPSVPVGEIIDWLNEFKDQGLILGFGGSNWHHSRIQAANDYAAANGKQGMSLNNPNLCLAKVNEPMWADAYTIEQEGRDWHAQTKFPLFAWSSMARGYFAGVTGEDVIRVYDNMTSRLRRDRAIEIGKKYGATPPQVALAWVLSQPGEMFALCGLRTADNAISSLEALDLLLSPEEIRWLEHGN